MIKSPLELFYGTARTLNYSGFDNNHLNLIDNMEESGQKLFNPPNIAGWPKGKEWLGGQKLEKRIYLLRENFKNIPSTIDILRNNEEENTNEIKNSYNENIEKFFSDTSKDQMAIETILLGYIPKDFATRKYASF